MKEQQIRDEFKKLVIEKIHGENYDKASGFEDFCKFDSDVYKYDKSNVNKQVFPLTLSRVMKAFHNKHANCLQVHSDGDIYAFGEGEFNWKLTKQNGDTATDDDQSIECIKSLLSLIK